jgi:hypothetical protein
LGVGSYLVVSTYTGDTNFSASSTFGFLTVSPAASTTTLAVNPTSVALGHETSVNLTPTVSPVVASAGQPTGTVTVTATNTVTLAATVLCSIPASQATGGRTCSPSAGSVLATGTYSLVASYAGDANFTASSSSAVTLTVTPASAGSLTLSLTPSATSVAYGNESAVVYSVTLGSATPVPTGTVTVATGTTTLCTVTLAAGAGSCAITSPTLLAVSPTNPVVATYTGDLNYSGSVSSTASVNLAVVRAPTTTGFVLSTSVVSYGGESVTTITATVTPGFTYGSATGSIAIRTGVVTLCTITLVSGSGNVGSCSPAPTALSVPGSPYSLTAAYSGDANFTGSLSSAQTLTVVPAVTSTTLTEAPTSVAVGQETSLTLTPSVTVVPVAAGSPSGSVTVTATNDATAVITPLCSLPAASATGSATCSPNSAIGLTPGTYTLAASYPGDPNFTASSGTASGTLTVTQASASALTLTMTPSGTSTAYGNESSVTYGVSFGSAVPAPTGVVDIVTGTTTLCTATLVGGVGSCAVSSPTLLPVSSANAVVATYAGDVDYSGSVSSTPPVNLAVVQAATTTGVSVVPAGVIYGSEHSARITVAVVPAFAGTPTGTVTVSAAPTGGGTPVALCTITLPTTSCTPADTALPAGTRYDLSASYSGDANFLSSSGSDPGALVVTAATTATSLVLSASTVQYGISPTFTAAVSPTTSGTPTGTVAVIAYVGGSPVTLCTIDLPSTTCVGTGTALATSPSPYSVIAVYSGDGNFTTSTSTSQNLTVTSNSTSTVAVLSPPSVTYGNESTAVISVTVAHTGAGTPTGTVAVSDSGTTVCVITLSGGAGTCSPGDTDFSVGGPYFFSATYSGDSAYTGSTSTPVSLTVTKASTTPSVVASPSTVTYGDLSSAVLTATVTPQFAGTPTGSVVFTVGTTVLCSVTLPTDTCTTPAGVQLPVGSHAVTATYSGDVDFTASTATTPGVITITQATSTTAVSVAPSSVAYGSEDGAIFAVTVTPQFGGTPTGSVTVSSGSTVLCTVSLTAPSSGSGTCATSALALPVGGPYDLTAVYSGDADVIGSTGTTPAALTVTKAGTTTVGSVSPATAPYGSTGTVQLSAQVFPAAAGTPTGTVTFTTLVGGTPTTLCTAPVTTLVGVSSASCTLPSTILAASTTPYDVTAAYSGDDSFTGSSGTVPAVLTVTQATTSTMLTSTSAVTTYGNESSVDLSATVTPAGDGVPTGSVTFSSDGTPLCTGTLSDGSATCTPADTVLDASSTTYPVTATYSGDTNFAASDDSATGALLIDAATTTTDLVAVTPTTVSFGTDGPTVSVSVAPEYLGGPTGTVVVTAVDRSTQAATTLCTAPLVTGPSGDPSTGSCTAGTVTLAPGSYDLHLAYTPGDGNFTTSTVVDPDALTVTSDSTTTAITAVSPSSVALDDEASVTITTAVTPVSAGVGAPAPTGTVTVSSLVDGSPVTVCTVTLPATTCHPAPVVLPVGSHALTATYSGDDHYTTSVSAAATLTVTEAIVTVAVTSSLSPSLPGRPVTFTATLAPPASGFPIPTGTVEFVDTTSGAVLCAATPLTTSGGSTTAMCTAIPPTTPVQQIVAVYSGDASYASTQGTVTQQIRHGYWTAARDGGVFAFGDAGFFGSMGDKPLNRPVVGIAGTADAGGYWLVATDGGVFAFGDAGFYGSMGNQHLNQPVVGMQPTRDGKGYWLVAADGGVFNYGDAKFYGSTGNLHLNSPIVGMVATDDGLGYFLVGADGGVFAFGDATFAGAGPPDSTSPIVGLAPTPSGAGYWLAAADGAVFNYGDAQFHGSMAGKYLVSPIVGTASTTDGGGYWLVAADGGVFAFGDAIFDGSTGNETLNSPMVAMADI